MTCASLEHLNKYKPETLDPRTLRILHEMILAQQKHLRSTTSEFRAAKMDQDDLEPELAAMAQETVECNEALARIEAELTSRGLEVA